MKIKILETFFNVSRNLGREFVRKLRAGQQARKTQELRKNKRSDFRRWEKSSALYSEWDERTIKMATFLYPGSNIIEFGAGNMVLKENLPPNCSYTPSDIYKRSGDVVVCDLNEPVEIDLSKYDTAVFSGVLEYVYDIDQVFEQLKPFMRYVVLSYSCKDHSDADRLERGWLSDYSRAELESVFEKHDYEIITGGQWRKQLLYSLKQKNYSPCE